MIEPNDTEVWRLLRLNEKAIKELNPASEYMRVYEAGQWDQPEDGDESSCDRIVMEKRRDAARRILDSAPDKMHARFGGFR